MQYLDFELEVSEGDGGAYTVRVLRSPAGEATSSMRLPFTGLALQNNLQALQIALLRSGTTRRRVDTPESKTVETFGKELWDALFSGDILGRFEASRNEARRQEAGMRIKLRFDTPDLAALPWEYLFDADRGDYVTLSASTPLVRYIALPEATAPLLVKPPLRVLAMVVSPSDLPALDVDRERQRLDTALGDLTRRGLVELVWMSGGTSRDLQQILWKGPWHVFHFIGHGGFDDLRSEGVVILLDDAGKGQRVSATDLGRLLGDHDPLRLAVLNACESARADQVDVFSSTAATLVRRGTPAVVAMQYEITDDAAIEFSRSFYEAVASGIAVDAALSEARKGIALAIPGTLEWGTPVLYMRAPDGVLFDIPSAPAPAPEPARPTPEPAAPAPEPAAAEPEPDPAAAEPEPARTAEPVVPVAMPAPAAPAGAVPMAAATPVVPAPERVAHASAPVAAAAAPIAVAAPTPATSTAAPIPQAGWRPPDDRTGGISRRVMIALIILFGFLIVFFAALGALSSVPPPDEGRILNGANPGGSLPAVGTRASSGVPVASLGAIVTSRSATTGILFSSGPTGDQEIYKVDPAGGVPVAITSDAGVDDRWPSWSPDGTQIAFTRVIAGNGDLYVMNADGSNARAITTGPDNDWAPSWSRDGILAFNSNRGETTKSLNDIWRMSLVPGDLPAVLVGETGSDERSPDWSPDGLSVAFSSDQFVNGRALYILDQSRVANAVTTGAAIDRNPTWSPDGTMLIFTRAPVDSSTSADVWSITPFTGALLQLTTDAAQEGNPIYSPDGTHMAFYRKAADGHFHLFVSDLTNELDLTASLAGDSIDPSWR